MAKLKAEVLFQQYQNRPHPLGHLLLGHIFRLNPIASATAPLTNRMLQNRRVQVAARERPPASTAGAPCPLSPVSTFAAGFAGTSPGAKAGGRGEVVLLDDCFTTYNEPEVGIATVEVLEAAGYRVRLAGLECCGRPAISKGLLAAGTRPCPGERSKTAAVRSRRNPDPGLRAELPGDTRRRVSRLPPGAGCRRSCQGRRQWPTRSSETPPACRSFPSLPGPAACSCTAIASKRPCSAPRARWPRSIACQRPGDQGDRLRLLRHGRVVRLRARPF